MMRIAVVSDSHGGSYHLERFVHYCQAEGIDQVFHLGDMVEDARWLRKQMEIPVCIVAGNCDCYSHEAREQRLNLLGKRLLLLHGDRYRVKYSYDPLSYYAEENRMDAVFFGHTHRAFVGYVGSALLINPGALKNGSCCVVELSERDIVPHMVDIDAWNPPA